jgi:hypothetical protein
VPVSINVSKKMVWVYISKDLYENIIFLFGRGSGSGSGSGSTFFKCSLKTVKHCLK